MSEPMPRGGGTHDWWAESVKLYRRLHKIEQAAQAVLDEADRIHDNDPYPIKYRAPYGALAQLRAVLSEQSTIDDRKREVLTRASSSQDPRP